MDEGAQYEPLCGRRGREIPLNLSAQLALRACCAFSGRKADDLFYWYTRQYTQEETEREKEAFLFMRIRTEDGGIGVHRQDGGTADVRPPFTEDCLRGLTQ